PVRGRDDLEDARRAQPLESVDVALVGPEGLEVPGADAVEARGLVQVRGEGLGGRGRRRRRSRGRRPVRRGGGGAPWFVCHPPCLPERPGRHGVLTGSMSMPPPQVPVLPDSATYVASTAASVSSPQTLLVASMTSPIECNEATCGKAVNSMSKTLSLTRASSGTWTTGPAKFRAISKPANVLPVAVSSSGSSTSCTHSADVPRKGSTVSKTLSASLTSPDPLTSAPVLEGSTRWTWLPAKVSVVVPPLFSSTWPWRKLTVFPDSS